MKYGLLVAVLFAVACGEAPTATTPVSVGSPIASASASDPHKLTVANVTKSIQDNQSFAVADLDGLQVQIAGGVITVWMKPSGSETDLFNDTARNAYTVSRATQMGWYKGVTKVIVRTNVDVTDKYGKESVDDGMFITITSKTAAKFSYDGLAGRILNDPVEMFCLADDANVPLYILKHLPSSTQDTWVNC